MHAQSSCGATINPIACENQKTGDPALSWDVSGSGDASIQGFTTNISAAPGEVVQFKIDTPSSNYRLDIYRMGYYSGMGARKVATVTPSASLPQNQPDCLTNSALDSSTAVTGGLRLVAGSERCGLGYLLRQAGSHRHWRHQSRLLRRP